MITNSTTEKRNQRQSKATIKSQTSSEPPNKRVVSERFGSVLAFIDGAPVSDVVIPYAEALADSLHTDLQILTVLEPDHEDDAQFDPVEWSLRRREASYDLDRLVSEYHLDPRAPASRYLRGNLRQR